MGGPRLTGVYIGGTPGGGNKTEGCPTLIKIKPDGDTHRSGHQEDKKRTKHTKHTTHGWDTGSSEKREKKERKEKKPS